MYIVGLEPEGRAFFVPKASSPGAMALWQEMVPLIDAEGICTRPELLMRLHVLVAYSQVMIVPPALLRALSGLLQANGVPAERLLEPKVSMTLGSEDYSVNLQAALAHDLLVQEEWPMLFVFWLRNQFTPWARLVATMR